MKIIELQIAPKSIVFEDVYHICDDEKGYDGNPFYSCIYNDKRILFDILGQTLAVYKGRKLENIYPYRVIAVFLDKGKLRTQIVKLRSTDNNYSIAFLDY